MYIYIICSMYGHHTSLQSMDQPGKVANPARGQLNREIIFPCPCACLRIWFRETGSAVPSRVSLLISILRPNLVLTYGIPSEFCAASIYETAIPVVPYTAGSCFASSGRSARYQTTG